MNKKTVFVVAAVVLGLCCVLAFILMLVFKDSILHLISPTPTPVPVTTETVTPAVDNVSGDWSGSYIVTRPSACAGTTGTWSASLIKQGSTITGYYSSDVGLGGGVTGTTSGSDVSWSVGGSGGVTFTGSISNSNISGTFTGPICTGNTHTSGTFDGSMQ